MQGPIALGWPCARDEWWVSPRVLTVWWAYLGRGSIGGQKKHFHDTLKASLKDFSTDPDVWESLALVGAPWKDIVVWCLAGASEWVMQ